MPPMMQAGTASPGVHVTSARIRKMAPTPMMTNGQENVSRIPGTIRVTRKNTPSRMRIVPTTMADLDRWSMQPPLSIDQRSIGGRVRPVEG